MLSWIVYGVGGSILGLLLGLLWMTIFGHPSKVERSTGKPLLAGLIVGLAGPFAYSEILTRSVGSLLAPTIKHAYQAADINGKMRYYRVVFYTKDTARAYAFGDEKDHGFDDHPVLLVIMKREGTKWIIDDSQVVVSDRLNKDMLVLPPYQ